MSKGFSPEIIACRVYLDD